MYASIQELLCCIEGTHASKAQSLCQSGGVSISVAHQASRRQNLDRSCVQNESKCELDCALICEFHEFV